MLSAEWEVWCCEQLLNTSSVLQPMVNTVFWWCIATSTAGGNNIWFTERRMLCKLFNVREMCHPTNALTGETMCFCN